MGHLVENEIRDSAKLKSTDLIAKKPVNKFRGEGVISERALQKPTTVYTSVIFMPLQGPSVSLFLCLHN